MIELRVLGTADLRGVEGGQAQAVLAQPKRLAVLAYLAAATPPGPQRRDTLLALLWPELDDARARNALNKTVHHLRRALGGDAVVSRGDDEIGLDPDRVACDVAAFERALDEGRLADALALYRGDLLDGFFIADAPGFERWLDDRRAALRRRAAEGARTLARAHAAAGRPEEVRRFGERAVALAGPDESALRELLVLLDRVGDRAGALHAHAAFARRLAAEYDSEPSPETQALVHALRSRSVPSGPPPELPPPPAPAAVAAPPPAPPAQPPTAPTDARHAAGARPVWRIAAGVVLAAAAVWGGSAIRLRRPTPPPSPPASVAVLPFLDLDADSSHRYLADGMTEELTDALARVEALRVPSRTAAARFRDTRGVGRGARVDSIGRELQVASVVEGSVRVAGDRVRVTAQLIDVASGYHRWSQSYDRELRDVLTVEEDIARAIVAALAGRLGGGRAPRPVVARAPRDPEAHDLYLRGRHLWRERSPASLRAAVADFERAIARDSGFALAWVGLADAYAVLPYFSSVPAADAFPRARAALARALELDSTLAEAYVSMAALMATDWDWPGAVRHFARAVALAPNDASARQWYGESLIALGRTDDALAEMRRARALDPRSAIIASDLGWFLLTARRYDDALPEFRAAIALDGRFAHAYEGLGCAYREMGRLDDAIAALRRAVALSPAGDVGRGYLGHALAVAGRAAEARRLLASLERARADGPGGEGGRGPPGWAIAAIHAGLGARDSALAWLDVAYRQRDPAMAYVKVDPVFAPLRDDARYRALLGRMGLAPARR